MKPTLRIRTYAGATFASVWLIDAGTAEECFLSGRMLPGRAEELAAALGLPVQREQSAWTGEAHPDDPDEFYGEPPVALSPERLAEIEAKQASQAAKKTGKKSPPSLFTEPT